MPLSLTSPAGTGALHPGLRPDRPEQEPEHLNWLACRVPAKSMRS
jgi:hypothetical protein